MTPLLELSTWNVLLAVAAGVKKPFATGRFTAVTGVTGPVAKIPG
jgi:hypothetical protein